MKSPALWNARTIAFRGLVVAILLSSLSTSGQIEEDQFYAPPEKLGTRSADPSVVGSKLNFQTDLFTGRLGYSIPISVPPGRANSQPGIALGYNSSGGNGWCGVGWDLSIGFIERDTRKGVPVKWGASAALTEYDDSEGFIVSFGGANGRLVNIGGNEYRSEVEGAFLKFRYVDPNWEATDKSGNKFYFEARPHGKPEARLDAWRGQEHFSVGSEQNHRCERKRNRLLLRLRCRADVSCICNVQRRGFQILTGAVHFGAANGY
jgi:hypothetical protein